MKSSLVVAVICAAGCGSQGTKCPQAARATARSSFSAVLEPNTNEVYVFDGYSAPSRPLADVWRYNFAGACTPWQELSPSTAAPSPRAEYAADFDSMRTRILYTGGVGTNSTSLVDTWAFDTNALTFTKLDTVGNLPLARGGRAAYYDATDDRLLLLGDIFYELDFANSDQGSWQALQTATMPPAPREDFASAVDPTRSLALMFGGSRDSGGLSNELFAYNFFFDRWQSIALTGDVPSARSGAAMAFDAQDNLLLVFGGKDASGVQGDFYTLQLDGNGLNGKFTRVTRPGTQPPARSDFAMLVSGDTVWLFGGSGACGELDDVWTLLLDGGAWQNPLPQSHC